jgi:triosephosphate isomerase
MKKLFIIANWKSNKIRSDVDKWMHDFSENIDSTGDISGKVIIVCPSFTLLEHSNYQKEKLKLPIQIGAQNVSPFEEGAYTGEIASGQLKELVGYVIIGHSERRQNFSESEELLDRKVQMAKKHNLKVIFCVQNDQTEVPDDIDLVAYEPVEAIGTGNPDTPENAENVAKSIKQKNPGVKFVL